MTIAPLDYQNPEDAKALKQLMNAYASDTMGGAQPIANDILEQLPQALAQRSDAYSALAWVDNQAVGLINGFEGFSTFKCRPLFNIHDLYLAPAYRKLGLAAALLEHTCETARSRGYCKVTLEVLDKNTPAKNLYLKHGFAPYVLNESTGHALFFEKSL